jgi:L-fucose isomerase-like protein
MKTIAAIYIANRYWCNESDLNKAMEDVKLTFMETVDEILFLFDNDITKLSEIADKDDLIIAIPLSGAVQPSIIETEKKYKNIIIMAAYIKGILSNRTSILATGYNAAPTVMDSYAVLKRSNKNVKLILSLEELKKTIKVYGAYNKVKGAKLLLIGETEPWVVSSDRDLEVYENKFDLNIVKITKEQVIEMFNKVDENDELFKKIKSYFIKDDVKIIEPTSLDIIKAIKLATVMVQLLKDYKADGLAVACFSLIKDLDTTTCFALSYINSQTQYVGSCEGDIESMISLLALKNIARSPLWMANPNIQSDRTINFAHCTSPLDMDKKKNNYRIRSHHESGRGASPEVELPLGETVTLFRIGNHGTQCMIQLGRSVDNIKENTCRTQVKINMESFDSYIENSLGCHMVITYGDIKEDAKYLAALLKIEVL